MAAPDVISEQPLVSVGLPTFNRSGTLRRAIDSVLTQDYTNLELIVSDNASSDHTQSLCQALSQQDRRLRYIRRHENVGAIRNFRSVLRMACGEYFMWLADDDWISDHYISRCVEFLLKNPNYSAVHGRELVRTARGSMIVGDEFDISQESKRGRVLAFYRQVWTNGTFYSVVRRSQLVELFLSPRSGGDWLLVAQLAYIGKIGQLRDVSLNRSIREVTGPRSGKRLASLSFAEATWSAFKATVDFLLIPFRASLDIGGISKTYRCLDLRTRFRLGREVLALLLKKNITIVLKKALLNQREGVSG